MKMIPHRARPAFTLVEMLVVVVIIGILSAILLPTAYRAFVRARNTRVALELSQIASAVEAYKQEHGDYPPDFSDVGNVDWTSTAVYRHVRKAFPRVAPTELAVLEAQALNDIDQAEALVFWLGGLSSDPRHPFTGPGGPIAIKGNNATVGTDRRGYGFAEDRLTMDLNSNGLLMSTDGDDDAFPVYLPPGQEVPYVYFNARTYGFFNAKQSWIYSSYSPGGSAGVARPMKSDETNPNFNATTQHSDQKCYYVNRDTFQIISAGEDNNYGEDYVAGGVPILWHFPSGNVCHPDTSVEAGGGAYKFVDPNTNVALGGRLDNITNFSEGTLEDRLP